MLLADKMLRETFLAVRDSWR